MPPATAAWIILLSGAALIVTQTDACSCMMQHPQAHYCDSDLVIKAKIVRSEYIYRKELGRLEDDANVTYTVPYKLAYSIQVNKVFKGSELMETVKNKKILHTAPNGAMCGVQLKNNTKYLITGYIRNNVIHTGLCQMIKEWSSLSVRLRKSVQFNFDRNCECKVEVCFRPKCARMLTRSHKSNSTCYWGVRDDPNDCFSNYAYCQLRADGRCKWSRNAAHLTCIQEKKTQKPPVPTPFEP